MDAEKNLLKKEALGNDHPDTLDSMNNLALVFQQGKYAEAETLQRQTLELKKGALGDDHHPRSPA